MEKYICAAVAVLFFTVTVCAQKTIEQYNFHEQLLQQQSSEQGLKTQRALWQKQADEWLRLNRNNLRTNSDSIFIPVVVHVLWHHAKENISDSQVLSQFTVLNNDFNSLNADTANTPDVFKSRRGKTNFYFRLAKQDPDGLPTNGINRKYTFIDTGFALDGRINFTALGGQDPWDPRYYLNIYVCKLAKSTFTFAITYFPGGSLRRESIMCDYRYFGTVGITTPPYDKGRTVTHEMGHYFNLDHIWGPTDKTALLSCTDDDHVYDTPKQLKAHYGCPEFPKYSCVPDTSDMFMNYMDYVDDACMNMFTQGQAERMIASYYVMTPYLKKSKALQEPVLTVHDAGIKNIISPAGNSYSCDTKISPVVVIKNYGSAVLQKIIVQAKIDGNDKTYKTELDNLNIAAYSTDTIQLRSMDVLQPGSLQLTIRTLQPNDTDDENKNNDALVISISNNSVAAQTLPFKESFTSLQFPPPGWSIVNPDGLFTWAPTTGALLSGYAPSAFMDNIEYPAIGKLDDLVLPALNFTGVTKPELIFMHAFAVFNLNRKFSDSLKVKVSADCGETWTTVFYKGGVDLSTADNNMFGYLSPDSTNQWKTNKIDLSAFANQPNVLICFENISGKDNLVYIDNVKVQQADAVTDVAAESAIVKQSACGNILIAPNPVNNAFRISGFDGGEKISVQCFNSVGQLVWQSNSANNEWLHLPPQLNAGIYFLHIAAEHTSCVKKMEVKK